ncbi:MAG: 23S rRNA (pseudouridine(1915)-N(3))-methyltransferase RlmH [Desulfovibrionales bacterium]
MLEVKCVYIGKLKQDFTIRGCEHYRKKISGFYPLRETEIKDQSCRDKKQKISREAKELLSRIEKKDFLILLSEHGKSLDTEKFASRFSSWLEMPGRRPCFAVAGPYGVDQQLIQQADFLLSLSPLTFPHELARVMLLEQIFRAATIIRNFPYHN